MGGGVGAAGGAGGVMHTPGAAAGAKGAASIGGITQAPGAAGGGGFMNLMKGLGPILFQQGTKENEAAMNALAQTGPPPQVQPMAAGGPAGVGASLGTRYAEAMRPRSTLPPTPRGAMMTQPNFGGVGGALSGGY